MSPTALGTRATRPGGHDVHAPTRSAYVNAPSRMANRPHRWVPAEQVPALREAALATVPELLAHPLDAR